MSEILKYKYVVALTLISIFELIFTKDMKYGLSLWILFGIYKVMSKSE